MPQAWRDSPARRVARSLPTVKLIFGRRWPDDVWTMVMSEYRIGIVAYDTDIRLATKHDIIREIERDGSATVERN